MATKKQAPYSEEVDVEIEYRVGNENFCILLLRFLGMYYKSLIVVIWPLITLPIFLLNNTVTFRCLYVVAMMAMFWVTEALPLPITSLIPVFLFPLMSILNTGDTCICYLNDTTMMFIGSLIIAVAIENSGLHMRVALFFIKHIGCSHRRLSFGLFMVTMFISMWISNTAATAMMIPIVETVLVELENQGLGVMFITEESDSEKEDEEPVKRPTNTTLAYYLAAAYASSIGGTGTIVGTGTNLTFKGIFEARFPEAGGIIFSSWMLYAIPPMVVSGILIWVWLQVMYMGLFRPNSKDAQAIDIGNDGEKVAAAVIEKKYKDLGPITWHEACVGLLFILVILLWFFRSPGFVTGWPEFFTDLSVKDSTAAIFVTLLLFAIPAKLDFINAFKKDASKRPTKASPSLVNWKLVQSKMHWGTMFVLGGGFALASGSSSSGLSTTLGNSLTGLNTLQPIAILFVVCLFTESITELTSNVAIANIILPVVAEMCVAIEVHPLYLMLPATFCCSFCFHLPVGTPPNAIASAAGHIKTKDFMVAGIGPTLITLIVITIAFPTWGGYVYDLDGFPSWAAS